MIEVISNMNVVNGKIVSLDYINELLEKNNVNIYEVIRVINRRPIFLREHYDRMIKSIKLSKLNFSINYKIFKENIELLISKNEFYNCNIRVSFYISNEPVLMMYFIKSSYPSNEQFKSGIYTVTAKLQRDNPNIKEYKIDFKKNVERILNESNAFEVILINEDDTISEGSKSNIFFVIKEKLVTSLDNAVLLGVTRGKIVDVCNKNGIVVEKRNIHLNELKNFDGAFITGTSNNVLPIRTIDDINYNSSDNPIIQRVSKLYLNEMNMVI